MPAIDYAREQVEVGLVLGGVRERLEADIAGRVRSEVQRHLGLSAYTHVSGWPGTRIGAGDTHLLYQS